MNTVVNELEEIIEIFKNDFSGLDEQITSFRISTDKWTLKEIIGHLIDSAANNHQRFVRLKLSKVLEFPDYNNSEWLNIEKHNNMKFQELLLLFYYYNKLIINIILNTDEKLLENKWNVNWDENSTNITFEKLIIHYSGHMKSHLTHFQERLSELENYTGLKPYSENS